MLRVRWLVLGVALAAGGACGRPAAARLSGEWDVYVALGSKPRFGFEGWRRMAFAHFAGADSGSVGFLRRRTGQSMLDVRRLTTNGDSLTLWQDSANEIRAVWHGDTLAGQQFTRRRAGGRPLRGGGRGTGGGATAPPPAPGAGRAPPRVPPPRPIPTAALLGRM